MKLTTKTIHKSILSLCVLSALTACGGSDSGDDSADNGDSQQPQQNQLPVAEAGTNFSAEQGDTINLDATGSSDANGDALTYLWSFTSQPNGSNAQLTNADRARASFVADEAGSYTLLVTVSDGEGSNTDSITVTIEQATVNNASPVANAGNNSSIELGNDITLNASSSSDSDGDTLSYQWSLVDRPQGSSAALTNANTVSTTFSPDVAGEYRFRVSVSDGTNAAVNDTVTITVTEPDNNTGNQQDNIDLWIVNDTNTSDYITNASGNAVLENVQLAELRTENAKEYMYVEATGIPDYSVTMTQDIITALNTRPKAREDFTGNGQTTAVVGDTVEFGEDIGYDSSNINCGSSDTGGDGYWPPGPACPTDQEKENYFPTEPEVATEECGTSLGAVGLMVNGTSIYNWSDGATWEDTEWQYLAPVAEAYDVDICGGHATTSGDYHHHFYTSCLADLVGDDGTGHSPIYGFAADGYPVYGPYESDGVLAVSGWKKRDYGASTSEGGCNTAGERTCMLVDQYDLSKGIESTAQGPDIGATVSSQSRNDFIADSGFFFEDYYYGGATATGPQLDQHNGHDNNDGRGYHYHITLEMVNGELTPSFPYTVGPNFKGELPDNTFARCTGSNNSGGPGGPGGPGPN